MNYPTVVIVGGGPGGIATAIQLKRFDIEPLMFEKKRPGGLLWNAHRVENYPGFPGGIGGAALAKRLSRHLGSYGVDIVYEEVNKILYHKEDKKFSLITSGGSYRADIVAAATGTKPRTGGLLELVPEDLEKFVMFEIYPLIRKKNRDIVIVGAGDIAFDYALHLAEKGGNKIVVIQRNEEIKALPLLNRRIRQTPGICFSGSTTLTKIAKGGAKKLALTFLKNNGQTVTMPADYLVIAVGRQPQRDCFTPGLREMERELLDAGRLVLVGDVKNGPFRQAGIAVGNGIEAAMKIKGQWFLNRRNK